MISEVMILAGGMGTRLRTSVPELPKVMAPVAGYPFIHHVVQHLIAQGVTRFVFLLGYKADVVMEHLEKHYPDMEKIYVSEDHPLGTGGAVKNGLSSCLTTDVGIVNGDTLFRVDLDTLFTVHHHHQADCTLALKPMHRYDRYGTVLLNPDASVARFTEKQFTEKGNINAGVYILNKKRFLELTFEESFSFEKDYLENSTIPKKLYASVQEEYFIDIGIPEDYQRAQTEIR